MIKRTRLYFTCEPSVVVTVFRLHQWPGSEWTFAYSVDMGEHGFDGDVSNNRYPTAQQAYVAGREALKAILALEEWEPLPF